MNGLRRTADWAIVIAVALALSWLLRGVIPIIALALLYAIATWPLVSRLGRHLPIPLAISIVDAGLALGVAAIAFAAGPSLVAQVNASLSALPHAIAQLLAAMPPDVRGRIGAAVAATDLGAAEIWRTALTTSFSLLRTASAGIAAMLLVPVLAAYFQLDRRRYEAWLFDAADERRRAWLRVALPAIAQAAGAFVRGQILVSVTVGALIYVALLVTGVPHAAGIAVLTALFDLVPYLGGVVAFVPSILFALTAGGIAKALLAALLIAAVFELEAQVLSPQIVGSRTDLPPSAVLISLLAGTALFGVFGLYLAVPVAASLRAAFSARAAPASVRAPIRAIPPSR